MMSARAIVSLLLLPFAMSVSGGQAYAGEEFALEQDSGYRGIWYQIKGKNFIKYSGGMATYPQQIRPMAIHAKAANKTFFVYGGRSTDKNELLHMVSYFDHATGAVPRPRILLNKKTADAHDNPALAIDAGGHLWIFSNTHGPEERSFIHRSVEPYSIDRFERVAQRSLSYGQPWYFEGRGFLLIQNRYKDGRAVAFQTSPDGRDWSTPQLLAQIKGHYQVSAPSRDGKRLGVMFNYHPKGLDTRTNVYHVETSDFGATWRTAAGEALAIPLRDVRSAALVHDYESEGLLVYLKDVQYDEAGNPILLYLTSKSHVPGADAGPHTWRTAHWTGGAWRIRDVTTSDHNYDFGPFYVEDSRWRVIAPTDPGPQPFTTGGEIVDWESRNEGAAWTRLKAITTNSKRQQTFVRQSLYAHPQFYAYWADGDAERESASSLYFTDKDGSAVWRLPTEMATEFEKPSPLSH